MGAFKLYRFILSDEFFVTQCNGHMIINFSVARQKNDVNQQKT